MYHMTSEIEAVDPDDVDDNPLEINSPISLIPDLADWGLEPVDAGVVEDSYENRRILRENRARWTPVYTKTGLPTNLIQVVTAEMSQARLKANKSAILTKPSDLDSDFLTGLQLILTVEADDLVPAWVLAATRHWEDVDTERIRRKKEGIAKAYRPALSGPPSRCRATTVSAHRCQNWADGRIDSNGLCRMHISNHHHSKNDPGIHTLAKARARILSATVGAVDELETLVTTATSEQVRLGAAKEILDRGGLRGGYEVSNETVVTVKPAADIVAQRLSDMRDKQLKRLEAQQEAAEAKEVERLAIEAANTEDAEVVEDES